MDGWMEGGQKIGRDSRLDGGLVGGRADGMKGWSERKGKSEVWRKERRVFKVYHLPSHQ